MMTAMATAVTTLLPKNTKMSKYSPDLLISTLSSGVKMSWANCEQQLTSVKCRMKNIQQRKVNWKRFECLWKCVCDGLIKFWLKVTKYKGNAKKFVIAIKRNVSPTTLTWIKFIETLEFTQTLEFSFWNKNKNRVQNKKNLTKLVREKKSLLTATVLFADQINSH